MKILLGSDKYENKARYVDCVMSDNAKITTLTDDQHDVLRWLCAIRHEIHSLDLLSFLSMPEDLCQVGEIKIRGLLMYSAKV